MRSFTCNLCGAANQQPESDDREGMVCANCGGSSRMRSVVCALSRVLFQCDIPLPDFPVIKALKGLGISDSPHYANALERHFDYRNTHFHQQPFLDIRNPPAGDIERYDFIICSEVLEHVPCPIEIAMTGLRKLLKPSGFLLVTVPYHLGAEITEHFASLERHTLAVLGNETVFLGVEPSGQFHVYNNLVFHGGHGATLEHRQFSESGIKSLLSEQGFPNVRMDSVSCPAFGIDYNSPCSLPIIASQGNFVLPPDAVADLAQEFARSQTKLRQGRESRWLCLGQRLGIGPRL